MDSPLLITYENTSDNPNSHIFFDTLQKNGWNYMQIGKGEVWNGFITRIKAYVAICNTLRDDDVIVLSDARDVFCVRSPKAFMDAFRYFRTDLVVSAEIFCDMKHEVPDDYIGNQCVSLAPYFKHHSLTYSIRKFVNAGLMAGKVHRLRHMWQWILDRGYNDDQFGVGNYMNTYPQFVRLDTDAILLHTSTFGVGAGVYAIHHQKYDSPSLAELCGCGAFFLHIPGIHNIGQKFVYDYVKDYLAHHSSSELIDKYQKPVPPWDAHGDLKTV